MRTRQRICQAKQRYPDREAATQVAARHDYAVRPYRCDRCHGWHLTSRLKGKWIPRPVISGVETSDRPIAPQAGLPSETPSGTERSGLS